MSVQGTGIAAAVAQTGLQAQQVGRQQAKRHVERARTARRLREVFETQLKEVEESDAAEAEAPLLHVSTTLRDAGQESDPPAPSPRNASSQEAEEAEAAEIRSEGAEEAEPASLPGAYAYDADGLGPPPPPRRHLDVQA